MAGEPCPTAGCGKPVRTAGLCNACYEYRRLHGTVDRSQGPLQQRLDHPERRFWRFVDRRGDGECWLWTGTTLGRTSRGPKYGRFKVDGKHVPAHRFAYELLVGPIPDGLEIDHVASRGCTSGLCVNPRHLEPVTGRENMARYKAHNMHCRRGHRFAGNEIIRKDGTRTCRMCSRERINAWKRQRRRAQRGDPSPGG